MGSRIGLAALILLGMGLVSDARAAVEEVYVQRVFGDSAIIVRRDGSSYLIEKGVGCLSLQRYEGREVMISSPSLFLGVGSTLVIVEQNQSCRIWSADPLGTSGPPPVSRVPQRNVAGLGSTEYGSTGSAVANTLQAILERRRQDARDDSAVLQRFYEIEAGRAQHEALIEASRTRTEALKADTARIEAEIAAGIAKPVGQSLLEISRTEALKADTARIRALNGRAQTEAFKAEAARIVAEIERLTQFSPSTSTTDEIALRIIVVGTMNEAQQVRKSLAEGTDFGALAREVSIDQSRTNGGSLGRLPRAWLHGEIQAAIDGLATGEQLTPVVTLPAGFAVLLVDSEATP